MFVEFEEEVERLCGPEFTLRFKVKNKNFHLCLDDILLCLRFAEENGVVPEIPKSWWGEVESVHPKVSESV